MTVVMAMKKNSYRTFVRKWYEQTTDRKNYLLDAILAELGLQDLVDNHELVVTLSESSSTAKKIGSVVPHERTKELTFQQGPW